MDERPANRRGREPLLTGDEETLKTLREFGRRGLGQAECARRLDVHVQTYRAFLRREPAASGAYAAGLAERREMLLADTPGRARPPVLETPKAGTTCPTCGGRVGAEEDAIMLTPAVLADARRRFENLIDRHIAARRGKEPGRSDDPGTGGAETDR